MFQYHYFTDKLAIALYLGEYNKTYLLMQKILYSYVTFCGNIDLQCCNISRIFLYKIHDN